MAAEAEEIALNDISSPDQSTNSSNLFENAFGPGNVSPGISQLAETLKIPDSSLEPEPEADSEQGRDSIDQVAASCTADADEHPPNKWKFGPHMWKKLKSKEFIWAVIAIATLIVTVLALWPSILSWRDTHTATLLAEWTARKDFLEFCSSVSVSRD